MALYSHMQIQIAVLSSKQKSSILSTENRSILVQDPATPRHLHRHGTLRKHESVEQL